MNRGFKWADKLSDWLFGVEWKMLNKRPEWMVTAMWYLLHVVAWFSHRHPFNPWRCDSCRFEARCGYESENEREIADRWRREQGQETPAIPEGFPSKIEGGYLYVWSDDEVYTWSNAEGWKKSRKL